DATGGLAYGGNWVLEASRGQIEAAAPIGAALQASYGGLLATPAEVSFTGVQLQAEVAAESSAGRQVATGARGTVNVWVQEGPGTGTTVMARFDAPDGTAGQATQVATGSGVVRSLPAVAVDDAGNALVAWSEGTSIRIAYLAAPTAAGGAMTVLGPPTRVDADDAATPQRGRPSVAMTADGSVAAVVWERSGSGGAAVDLLRLQLDPSGDATTAVVPLGSPTMVAQGAAVGHPDVALRADGSGVVVLATSVSAGSTEVSLVRFDASGVALPPSQLAAAASGSGATLSAPTLALDVDTGRGLAVWVETTGTSRALRAIGFDAAGSLGSGVTLAAGIADVRHPSVAATGGNRFAVAFDGTIVGGAGLDVGLVRVAVGTAGAVEYAAVERIVAVASGDQRAPSVAAADGRLVVAWADGTATSGVQAAFERVVIPADTTVTSRQLPTEVGADSGAARQVATGAAGTVTVWAESAGTGRSTIFARFDAADGTIGARTQIASGGNTLRTMPSVAVDADGRALIAWTEGTSVRVAYFGAPTTAGGSMARLQGSTRVDVSESLAPDRGRASVAMSADGRSAVVAWERAGSAIAAVEMRRLQLDPDDESVSTVGSVLSVASAFSGSAIGHPDVAIGDDGAGVVVLTTGSTATDASVTLVRFDGTGILGTTELAKASGGTTVGSPTVAWDPGTQRGLAVWIEQVGTTQSVRARAFDASGAIGTAIALAPDVSDARRPSVAALGGDRFAVAFDGTLAGGAGLDVGLARVAIGTGGARVLGAVQPLNVGVTGDQRAASVAAADGRVVVSWADDAAGIGAAVGLERIVLPADATVTDAQRQAESGSESGAARQVATGARGTVFVWTEVVDGRTRVVARFDAADGTRGLETTIAVQADTETGTAQRLPAVAVDDAGNAVFSWVEGGTIRVAYYAAPALPGGTLGAIQAATRVDLPDANASGRGRPSVAISADGRYAVVAWERSGTGGTQVDLRRLWLEPRRADGSGGSMTVLGTAPTVVPVATGEANGHPDVVVRNDGSVLVLVASGPSADSQSVRLVRFAADGTLRSQATLWTPDPAAPSTASAPTLAFDTATGRGLAVWIDTAGSQRTVRAIAFDADGFVGSAIAVATAVTDASRPSVAALGADRFA
ncbi:MAG: hypothetical protein WCK28_19805, partial [Burkholderiales bacterium]